MCQPFSEYHKVSVPCRPPQYSFSLFDHRMAEIFRDFLQDIVNIVKQRHGAHLTQYCAGDKIEKIEMGGTCCKYGGRDRCAQGFGGET